MGATVEALLDQVLSRAAGRSRTKPAAIHALRVDLKRLRAWLRLAWAVSGASDPVIEADRYLREAGRLLAPRRDAQVRRDLLLSLAAKAKTESVRREIAALLEQAESAPTARIDWQRVRLQLVGARQLLPAALADASAHGRFEEVLAASHRLARRRADKILHKGPSPAAFHALRKAVKRLGYQIECVPLDTDAGDGLVQALAELGRGLGRINDLHNLLFWLDARSPVVAAPHLGRWVRRRLTGAEGEVVRLLARLARDGRGQFVEPGVAQ